MPRSMALWIVRIDSASSLPPHMNPPIAQVPSAIRVGLSFVSGMAIVSSTSAMSGPAACEFTSYAMYLHYQRLCRWRVPPTSGPSNGSFSGYTERGPMLAEQPRFSRPQHLGEHLLLVLRETFEDARFEWFDFRKHFIWC